MSEKLYTVRFKPPESSVQPVQAATEEVADGYLLLLREDGSVAALFCLDYVESWSAEPISK